MLLVLLEFLSERKKESEEVGGVGEFATKFAVSIFNYFAYNSFYLS